MTRRSRTRRTDRGRFRWWTTFAWAFGAIGFALGTLTLLGPVRWMTMAIRDRGGAQWIENFAVILAIVVLTGATAAVAYYVTERTMDSPRRWVRMALPLGATLPAALALWVWMTPEVMAMFNVASQSEEVESANFTFGPYPDEAKLRALKGSGYTAVITLLHPAVIPFEPRLLATETKAAERAGIPLIHLPMLPWVSDNAEALMAVRRLAESGEGRYYVHCYLGVDRVNVVRRIVENVRGIDTAGGAPAAGGRRIEDLARDKGFERGAVLEIAEGVFVTPYPTGEEWNSFIIGGRIRTVVSLLDPEREGDRRWIARERSLLESAGVTFVAAPVPASGSNREVAVAAVAAVRAAEKPVVVHGFLVPSRPVDAFIQAFRSSAP